MKKKQKTIKTTKSTQKTGKIKPRTVERGKTTNKSTTVQKIAHKSNDKVNFSKTQAKKTANAKNKRKVQAITIYYK